MQKSILHERVYTTDHLEAFLELFSETKKNTEGNDVTTYKVTYLTPVDPIGDEFDCNNTECYHDLKEAKTAFKTRLNSKKPMEKNPDYVEPVKAKKPFKN